MIGVFFVKRTGSLSFVEDVNNGNGIAYAAEVVSGNIRHGIELDFLRVRKELTIGTSTTGPYIKTTGAAADINSSSTKIDPSKVQLTVGATLADWRATGDLTKIDGGKIYTGSVITSALAFTPLISAGGTGAIVATINASSEGIRISGSRITIDGNVNFTSGYDPSTKITAGGAAADINANATTISGGKITTGSITADKLNVSTLSAITANLGTVTAGTLTGATIQTASSGTRIVISNDNKISFYNNLGSLSTIEPNPAGLDRITFTVGEAVFTGGLYASDAGFTSLGVGASKFIINSSGQITKVNNTSASSGYYLRGDGTSFIPSTIQSADVTSALGYTPVTNARTINGYALTSNVTLTKSDLGLGSVENTALSTWAGSSYITTLGTIGNVLTLDRGIMFNNAQDYTVTSTDNSNGYFTMTNGKNYLRLTPQGNGYSVGIYGMTDRVLIMVTNLHASYSITVEGKTLGPKASALMMYEAANSIVRIIG